MFAADDEHTNGQDDSDTKVDLGCTGILIFQMVHYGIIYYV